MKLEEIFEMWKQDCKIDQARLADCQAQSPVLHQKYLQIHSNEKMRLVALEMSQKKLLKKKWLYYNGKMTKEEMDTEGWDYDPMGGLKIMKGDMNHWYDADDDIQKSEAKIKLQKEKIEVLKEIIDNIKWRHQSIKNIITWKQFEAGI